MTQMFGRMTANAIVNRLKDDREVVNFTIAVNDWYKSKGSGELVKTALFVNCSYWLSAKMAAHLLKGCLVEINGRLSVRAYTDGQGAAKASLDCHANFIKIHYTPKENEKTGDKPAPEEMQTSQDDIADDLPF